MKTVIQLLSILFTSFCLGQSIIGKADFKILNNTNWKGELMYVNYADGKEVILPTTLHIEVKGDKIIFDTSYTYESSANSKEVIKIKKNGTVLGDEAVLSKTTTTDGTVTILTKYKGKDDNKPATMFKSYVFNATIVTITKEVQFDGTSKRFVRNRYSYKRN